MHDRTPIVRLSDAGVAAMKELAVEPPELLRRELGESVRSTPLRRTARVRLEARDCYVKSYLPGAGRAGKIAGRRAPAEAEWGALGALAREGFRVPEGLCAVWCRAGDRAPSAILLAAIEGARELDHVLAKGNRPAAVRWLVDRLAPWVRRLHDLGFQHRDLYAGHLFLADDFASDPALIDVARVRKKSRVSRRARIKDLAALCYSLVPLVEDEVLERMILVYAAGTSGSRARALVRSVRRRGARIARHVPRY